MDYAFSELSSILSFHLEQSLELRCDGKVVQKMTLESKASYLETMLSVLKTANSSRGNNKAYCSEPVLNFVANKPIYLEERFQVIANKARKTDIFKASVLYIAIIAIVFCSYTFILMAHYDPPIEDIIEGPDCYEIDFDTDYFSINCDGTFSMHLKDGTVLDANLDDYKFWIKYNGKVVQE